VNRSFNPLTESQRQWIGKHLTRAGEFAQHFDPQPNNGDAMLDSLDRAFQNYIAIEHVPSNAKDVILAVGAAFGSALVTELGFQWVIATDHYGTGLAVLARPNRGDVTIFPTDFVAKRYEHREAPFLRAAFDEIRQNLRQIAVEWGDISQ
jgi:Domain of unknown function (DUF3806)